MDLVEMLESLGHQVVGQAATGTDVLAAIRTCDPEIVLLDISMPGMDGLDTIESIDQLGGPAVIMVTAFAQAHMVERAVAAGAAGYLVKPFTAADLAPVIEVARARHADLRAATREASSAQDRLAARVAIEQAKGHLMRIHGVSEQEAFGLIRRQAMDERIAMAQVAERILTALDL